MKNEKYYEKTTKKYNYIVAKRFYNCILRENKKLNLEILTLPLGQGL